MNTLKLKVKTFVVDFLTDNKVLFVIQTFL